MSEHPKLNIVILAAGQGSRMKSALPKVLHPLAGKPMLGHVIACAAGLNPQAIITVYGHGGEQVKAAIGGNESGRPGLRWAEQSEQLGTGHAVMQAMPEVHEDSTVLILYGDVPLIETETLAELCSQAEDNLALLTVHLADPGGYGRILRDEHGRVIAIVEEKDAGDEQRRISEVNTGIMALPAVKLKSWLDRLDNKNAQAEYYLTDIIAMAVGDGMEVKVSHPGSEAEVMGVNSRNQLAVLERIYQRKQAGQLMQQGVTVIDPARIDIRGELQTAADVTIDINSVFAGKVSLGQGVYVGPNCILKDCVIEDGVEIQAMSVIEQAHIGAGSRIGPFARLRPGTRLAHDTHIGNFVEIKNSTVDNCSKINHLSYVGDSTVGARVNIGAGTITCNYDGANKHRTVIGDDAFIGSDSQLVAPVEVGQGATLAAGTTLTNDAAEKQLTLSRVKQKTLRGWKRPTKKSGE